MHQKKGRTIQVFSLTDLLLQFTATADTISGATLNFPAICKRIEGI